MRLFIELSYDGSNYKGWQRQPNAPTVQGTLEGALGTLLGSAVEVVGAGRTDTGVHAARYVAHVDLPEADGEVASVPVGGEGAVANPQLSTFNFQLSTNFIYHLNAILPPDVAVSRIWPCPLHARFDAREREYQYYISMRKDPFSRTRAWQYLVPLDVEAMNAAAARLLTVRDFTTFAKLGGNNKTNYCTVTRAEWTRTEPHTLVFTIRADRFLRNMVRAIVGTLVDVGRGKLTPQEFEEIVLARDLARSSGGAPAHGLFLSDISY